MALDLTALRAALADNDITVLTAPPGTGKTTTIPPALMGEPWLAGKKILVLEPRRLAARRAAQYVAEQLGEQPGERVGWQVRMERKIGPKTQIEFLTEGLLARRILDDPELSDVGCILFDEFHERALPLDIAFALAREVREGFRPDLRLLIMSATLQSDLFPEARFISIPAVAYPVEIVHLGAVSPVAAILKAVREETGSILCFLPGEGEIRSAAEALEACELPPNVRIAPLYAALSRQEQDRAVAPPRADERKIVLATSIAESSVTIEGIRVVVDTGLARVPKFAPRNGLTRLVTQVIPMDRATQRTGRAGRLCPGICYRLWEAGEERVRAKVSQPEILDADLTQVALMCAEWGSYALPWLTPPPVSAWERARENLYALGATDTEGRLTPLGHKMVRFAVHPALAAMMLRLQTIDRAGAALLAAICAEGEKFASLRTLGDFRKVVEAVLRERPHEIWHLARQWASGDPQPRLPLEELIPYLLYAFPGHLARRRDKQSGRYLLAAGFGATLPPQSPLINAEWLLVVRMNDGEGEAIIRWATPLTEKDLALCSTHTQTRVTWDKASERMIAAEETRIGAILLKSRPLKEIPPEARLEAERCRLRHQGLPWDKGSEAIYQRLTFLSKQLGWEAVTEDALIERLAAFPKMSLYDALVAECLEKGHALREVDCEAPTHLEVPSGSHMRIHYDGDQPYVAVKIQEVFGLKATPSLAQGRIPILLHLLSPAQRPVQVTSDLASFWANGYKEVRKDLRGRYPKHNWPEDPTTAVASRRTLKPRT